MKGAYDSRLADVRGMVLEPITPSIFMITRTFLVSVTLAILAVQPRPGIAGEPVVVELHQSMPLAKDGAVSVQNVNGFIRLTGWDKDEVRLDAVKRGRTQAEVDEVKVEISAETGRVKIVTQYPDRTLFGFRKNNRATVDYTLKVPRTARLQEVSNVNGSTEISGVRGPVKASNVNGPLFATQLANNAHLSNVNGKLQAQFEILEGSQVVALSTVNGAIELTMPAESSCKLSVHTLNGSIKGDRNPKRNFPIGSEFKETLGGGSASIEASSVNGGIRLVLGKAPVL